MSGYILRGGQENITLPASAAESLLKRGDGDAALLYLALQRFGRGVTPEELERVLPTMSRLRMDAAEGVLQELGLLPRPRGGKSRLLHGGHFGPADGQRGLPPADPTGGAAAG